MKEFDSIRIVDKGESISFEMTGDVAENPHEAAEAFGKVFTKHVAQDIQDERNRPEEDRWKEEDQWP